MRQVVITGIGLITPIGVGIEACWDSLRSGRTGTRRVEGFDATGLPVRIAGQVRDFQPETWLTRKEVLRLDRVQQFALAAAQLAIDDAGALPAADRTGVVVGSGIGGAATMEQIVLSCLDRSGSPSPLAVPNSIVNMPAALVAQRFGFRGPSCATATACSASTDALGQAMRLVRDGYADACLAGGTEACVIAPVLAGFASMRALSTRNEDPGRASRPFDAQRDGFVLAEGAGMVLLETAERARGRGAHIYAELCGFGQTNDAFHMTAPDPSGERAAAAMMAALEDARMEPYEVDYVNAHATSTRMADLAESAAIERAFGDHSRKLAVSSTKSATGHLLGAAGAVEAAICALSIDRQWIPPTVNYECSDPGCDLDYVPNLGRCQRVVNAMSNSFAFGGHNSSLAFREYPWGQR